MSEESPIGSAPTETTPAPEPARKIVCKFCECELYPSGEVKKKSDRARALENVSEELRDLKVKALQPSSQDIVTPKKSDAGAIVW